VKTTLKSNPQKQFSEDIFGGNWNFSKIQNGIRSFTNQKNFEFSKNFNYNRRYLQKTVFGGDFWGWLPRNSKL